MFSNGPWRSSESVMKRKNGGILDINSLHMLEEKKDIFFPLSFIIHNTKPVGQHVRLFWLNSSDVELKFSPLNLILYIKMQDLVGLVISMLLLADISLVLLTLLQLYSISLADVLLVLFVLPLGILLPFPAGINALFSHGPRRSASLARVYSLWNITSMINVVSSSLLIHGTVQIKWLNISVFCNTPFGCCMRIRNIFSLHSPGASPLRFHHQGNHMYN